MPSPAWQHALTCLVEPYRRMWASLGKPRQRVTRRLGVRGASDEEVGLGRRRQIGELGALWWQTCGRRVADVWQTCGRRRKTCGRRDILWKENNGEFLYLDSRSAMQFTASATRLPHVCHDCHRFLHSVMLYSAYLNSAIQLTCPPLPAPVIYDAFVARSL